MKIAVAQINPTIGDFEGNIRLITTMADQAASMGCELAVFPEMALCGYPPRDLLERPDFIRACEEAEQQLLSRIKGTGVLCGTITPVSERRCGASLYNSALLFKDGQELARVHKRLLPVYDVFDETRYFRPGAASMPVDFMGLRLGITVCEDIWSHTGQCGNWPEYCENPVKELADNGAELIVNISASPYTMGKAETRECILAEHASNSKIPFIYCNAAGGQDSLVFDGASMAVDATGAVVSRAKAFCEDTIVIEIAGTGAGLSINGPMHQCPQCNEEEVVLALELGLRDYTSRCSITRVTLGLSGGIDSAVTAAIACRAIGRENVLGVIMPSPYTSRESIEDAEALAENLGIERVTIPIDEIFSQYLTTLEPVFAGREPDVAEENIQARIRGNILMAISNKLGHMVLTTGNKSELAVGYCTLYGDMSGGYALISDLPKTLVYRVARWLNSSGPIIPRRVITKPPSAELRPGQTDQDDLPPYDILDPILEMYLEQALSPQEIAAHGFDMATVRRITAMVDRNEYKRQQAPPGPKVTTKAFGIGRRYPIAHRFSPRH